MLGNVNFSYLQLFEIQENDLFDTFVFKKEIMIVCVAEKPSVGKEIAKVLGASKSRDGYMEGNGYQVTWTFGHLCCLKAPEDYDRNWKRWTLKDLPLVPSRFGRFFFVT